MNHQSVCLRQKSVFLKNVVCDLYLRTHDVKSVTLVIWTWYEVIAICYIKSCPGIRETVDKIPPKVLILPYVLSLRP